MPLVTLTTDFGDSAYTGALRAAVLAVAPEARLVDVTHGVAPQDLLGGALALLSAVPYFPRGSIHVAVVDPGVGTSRAMLLLEAGGHFLVGPDNGLLVPVAERLGISRAWTLDNRAMWRDTVSPTFHGRDVFGPVAGHLANGVAPAVIGRPIHPAKLARVDWPAPALREDGFDARVLVADRFGNLVTNVDEETARARLVFGRRYRVRVGDAEKEMRFARTFGDVAPGEALLLIGSAGLLEVAVNGGSAREALGAGRDVTVLA